MMIMITILFYFIFFFVFIFLFIGFRLVFVGFCWFLFVFAAIA